MGTSFQTYFIISQHSGLPTFGQFWKRRTPTNHEDQSKHFFKIMGMRSISIKKHEWFFGSILPENMKCNFDDLGSIKSNV